VPNKPNPRRTRSPGRALSDDELAGVIGAAYTVNEASALIVVAMGRLGLRVGEALALRRGDFDLSTGLVTIERSRDRDGAARPLKGRYEGDRRVIPLPQSVRDAYARQTDLQDSTPISGDLFVTSRSTPLIYNNWRKRQWTRIIDEANMGHAVPHDLRHTCITRLFIVGRWTPAEVQAFVGHTDARVTLEIYSHVNPATLPVPSDPGIG